MRDRRDILNRCDIQSSNLQGPNSCFATAPRAPDEYLHLAHPVFLGSLGCRLRSQLRSIRCSLTRPLKASATRTPPRDNVALRVRDSDNHVIECGMDISLTLRDRLLLLLSRHKTLPLPKSIPSMRLLLRHAAPSTSSSDSLTRSSLGSRISPRSLSPNRKSATVSHTSIRAYLCQPADIKTDLLSQIAFHSMSLLYVVSETGHLFLGQLSGLSVGINSGLGQYSAAQSGTYSVDISQTDLNPLVAGNVNTCYTWHCSLLSILAFVCALGWSRSPSLPLCA